MVAGSRLRGEPVAVAASLLDLIERLVGTHQHVGDAILPPVPQGDALTHGDPIRHLRQRMKDASPGQRGGNALAMALAASASAPGNNSTNSSPP